MRRIMVAALAGAAFAAATPASATLHGFCGSGSPCTDNGTNTPTNVDPPQFGFSASPGPATGTLLVDILVPNDVAKPSPFTISGALLGSNTYTANLFSTTAWTSGQLDSYLGISAGPSNPIGAYLPSTQTYQPGATGFWVYQANVGSVTLPGNNSIGNAYTMLLGQGLTQGSYVVGYLRQDGYDATANSGAIFEDGKPPVPEPATWAMMLVGFGGIGIAMRRRKTNARLLQVA